MSDLFAVASHDAGSATMTLAPGERHALSNVDPVRGLLRFRFRERDLSIPGDAEGQVLFPTDVGLSLVTALDHDRSVVLAGKRVLDVGCGSGLYTIAALAEGAATVSALDVSAACVATTLDNVAANDLNIDAVQPLMADLAEVEVTEPWDVVLANPPHFPYDPIYATSDGLQTALVGGADGRVVYDALLSRLDDLLSPGGILVLAHSSLTGIGRTAAELTTRGYACATALVVAMDMPLRRYAAHRHHLLARLFELRRNRTATFSGLRFEVHVLIVRRIADAKGVM